MRFRDISDAATDLLRIYSTYHAPPPGELAFELALHAYLHASFGHMSRQLPVRVGRSTRRIDLRYGGTNPVVIELALRPRKGGVQLNASQNRKELLKLSRIPQSRARRRALLLVDLFRDPIPEGILRPGYDREHAGRGNFCRRSVRIIYAHEGSAYDFIWWPWSH